MRAPPDGACRCGSITDVDLFAPGTYAGGVPHEAFARLRQRAPVCWHPEPAVLGWREGPGFWAVLRYVDVDYVIRTPEIFSSHLGATQIRDPAPKDLAFQQKMMLNMDPPAHTRLRRLISKGFTPRAVETLEEKIRARARGIVDRVAERGECDFAHDVAADLPLMTLAEIMGVPMEDRTLLREWSNRIIGFQDEEYARGSIVRPQDADAGARPVDPRSREALADMFAYALALAEEKRRRPTDDIISVLATARVDGERLSDEEFENFFFLLAVAGNETLRNGIPGGMYALLLHPDQRRRLLSDPSLLPTAVEEMLRWWTPVMLFRRTAARDTEVGGQRIQAGQKVVVFYVSANRDEEVFANPDVFDVARTPNDHLSFGGGPHFCMGASLARLQMRIMFEELLRRLPDMEMAGPVQRLQSNFQNGIKRMPVRYTPEPTGREGVRPTSS